MNRSLTELPENDIFKKVFESIGRQLKDNHKSRLVLFGGGQFTQRFLPAIQNIKSTIDLIAIIDDKATPCQEICDVPVISSNSIKSTDFDAIFLATDSIEELLHERVQQLYSSSKVYSLSGLMEENNIGHLSDKTTQLKTKTIWQRAYEMWKNGGQCAEFKDCVVLATIWGSSAHYPERELENNFVLKNLKNKANAKVLDIGSSALSIPSILLQRGFDVTCIDPCIESKTENGIKLVQGDICATSWEDNSFDYITCISTIEHIGVTGRYGITEKIPNGDIQAIREMTRLLKPGGQLFLTIPFGTVPVLPINNVYTHQQILKMASNLKVLNSAFHRPDGKGGSVQCSTQEASDNDWRRDGYYALGCYQFEK